MAGRGIGVSFLLNLANTLGIPLGAKRKKYTDDPCRSYEKKEIAPQIAVIAEITRDDICLTDSPFFYNSEKVRLGKLLKSKLDIFNDCLNAIARSTVFDLLTEGYSVYKFRKVDNEYFFEPLISEAEFYLVDNKVVTVVEDKIIDDVIVFINYEKRDLEVSEFEDKVSLKINPVGFQTRYTKDLTDKLKQAEDALARLRNQTRYVRFATVEVGLNKGDSQQEVVDDISDGLNANSQDLPQPEVFQDYIPVFPTRKGIGKPELQEYAPNTELGKLTDIEYYQTQLALFTRFPKSYSDFSSNLSATALSMIRGDIRYERLLSACRSCVEKTVNDYVKGINSIQKAGVTWHLKSIPSSEDTDVIDTLESIVQLVTSILQIIDSEEDEFVARQKVNLLLKTFDAVRESVVVSEIKSEVQNLINLMFNKDEEPEEEIFTEDLESVEMKPRPSNQQKPETPEDEPEEQTEEQTEE